MQRQRLPAVYIMANRPRGTLYTGVTSDLLRRAHQHREGLCEGFSRRYGCRLLVWYEQHETMESASLREKQIKAGSRRRKCDLVEVLNPTWRDLYPSLNRWG